MHAAALLLLLTVWTCGASRVWDGTQATETSHCMGAPGLRPPLARRIPKRLDTAAGPVLDDFYWLRDDTHADPHVLAYLTAENEYSDAALQHLQPLAGKLANEMEGRLSNVTQPVPVRHGSWWYNERQNPGQSFWLRYRLPAKALDSNTHTPETAASSSSSSSSGSSSSSNGGGGGGDKALGSSSSSSSSAAPDWDESGPDLDAPEQVVLDPNYECAIAAGYGGSSSQHCDVFGATVSPDGALVAFGVDISGSEQYQLMVRDIASSRAVLPAAIPGTSGDYEWAGSSQALFFITRSATTNRPDQCWYVALSNPSQAVLLWQEDNPAFYLSLSLSSSGRFLLLSSASEVTRQVLLMDLAATASRSPSQRDWLQLAPRQAGVQQQAVAHWQSWLFMLVVSPDTPNGELRVAPISHPHQHTVLLAHREEVELEDVRLFAHHLVLAERQLGHTTITVYCLPANSSQAAAAACKYNSTAASAAEAQAAAELSAAAAAAAAVQPGHSQQHASSSSSSSQPSNSRPAGAAADDVVAAAAAAAQLEQLIMHDTAVSAEHSSAGVLDVEDSSSSSSTIDGFAEPLLDIEEAVSFLDAEPCSDDEAAARQQSKSFLLIRGRAGSTPVEEQTSSARGDGATGQRDPAVAVQQLHLQQQQKQQQQQHQQQQQQQQVAAAGAAVAVKGTKIRSPKTNNGSARSSRSSTGGGKPGSVTPSASSKPGSAGSSKAKSRSVSRPASGNGKSQPAAAAAAKAAAGTSEQLHSPRLAPDNSWQVAFEEDAYSVSILSGDWATPSLRLSYTSFTTPHSVIDIDMTTQRRMVRSVARVGGGFRSAAYRSYRLWAAGADGVSVPLSLVYRLDMFGRNGLNPALLMVYGAYGTKYDPEFDSRLLALLDRGWVVGIAHVRGGGELGYAWHAAGRLGAKSNSFSDLIACARTLVAHNLTSPSRLALWGRSAGALTAAAALNAAPDLFYAAVLDVPFLDVLGDLLDVSLPLTAKEWEEWGNPSTNASLARVIASYSPVHNVRRGVDYPHMLVTAGLMDKRVGYWEAAKWVAQLRTAAAERQVSGVSTTRAPAAFADGSSSLDARALGSRENASRSSSSSSSSVDGPHQHHQQHKQLLLLRTDMSGGHFSAGGSSSSLDDAALKYAFLIATLPSCGSPAGLTGPDPPARSASDVVSSSSWPTDSADHMLSILALLPPVLQQLLMLLAGSAVVCGLVGLVWQASRVWWPAISPADLYDLVDNDDIIISELLSPHIANQPAPGSACAGFKHQHQHQQANMKQQVAASSSAKLMPASTGRDVARRVSTAASERLHQSLGESLPLPSGSCADVPPFPPSTSSRLHTSCGSSARPEPHLLSSSGSGGNTAAASGAGGGGVSVAGAQGQVVFSGLVDDWLMDLTSGVPSSNRPGLQPSHQHQQQHYGLFTPGSPGPGAADLHNCCQQHQHQHQYQQALFHCHHHHQHHHHQHHHHQHHQQQHPVPAHAADHHQGHSSLICSTSSVGSSSASTSLRPIARRCSNGVQS